MIARAVSAAAAAIAMLTAGCATDTATLLTSSADQAILQTHLTRLETIDSWNIHGRMALVSDGKGGSGSLIWKRERADHEILMFGSFGDNRLQITQNADGARIVDSKGEVLIDDSADYLILKKTGLRLPPLENLRHWVLGSYALAPRAKVTWDTQGRLRSFEQSGWSVRYSSYRSVGDYQLPEKIRAVSTSAYDADMSHVVKLSIRSWGIESP